MSAELIEERPVLPGPELVEVMGLQERFDQVVAGIDGAYDALPEEARREVVQEPTAKVTGKDDIGGRMQHSY